MYISWCSYNYNERSDGVHTDYYRKVMMTLNFVWGVAVLKSFKRLRDKPNIMEAGEDTGKLIKRFYLIQEERIKVYSTFNR